MDQAGSRSSAFVLPLKALLVIVISLLFLGWLLSTPDGLLGKADAIGYAVCHRIDGRSFHLGDRQLPLCVRCTGMFLAAGLALIYQGVRTPRYAAPAPWRVWVLLGVLVAAFAFDGINSYLHLFPGAPGLYEPQHWLRLLTGSGMGIVIAILIYPAYNQTVWKQRTFKPSIPSLRSLLVLMGVVGVLDLLVLTENPLILYPLALASAASVLVLLTIVYAVVWLILLRKEGRYQSGSQLWLPLVAGFGTAILQIAAIDWMRFLLTGTWGGFHIG